MSTFKDFGNPFEEDSSDLLALDCKETMKDNVVQTVKKAFSIGQRQYKEYNTTCYIRTMQVISLVYGS